MKHTQNIKTLLFVVAAATLISFPCVMAYATENVLHFYDHLNRLTESRYSDGTTITYGYDKIGNRISKKKLHNPRMLTVQKTGSGAGTVLSTPAQINCGQSCSNTFSEGSNITLAAVPDSGSSFNQWSGGGCGGANPCVLTMAADTIVTALFSAGSGTQPTIRTVTVKPSGGDYTSLNAALAAEAADLVALNRILYVECYAMQDTTTVNLTGFTTDADHYIRIYTPSSERHQGKWDTTKYRLETSGQAINIAANYVRIEGLQIQVTASSGTNANGIRTVNVAGAGDIWISHCIIKGVLSGTVTYSDGISNGPDTATVVRIFNNLFLDWNRSGASTFIGGIYTSSGTANYFNNTFVNCYQGMYRDGGNVVAKNNLMYTCNQPAGGTFDAGTDYNATDNASVGYTVTGGGNTHDRVSQTFGFVNAAGGDYHLGAGDTGAKDHGIDDPGAGLFSDDIDGQARQSTWDIGADEYATSGILRKVTVKPSGGDYPSLNAALAAEAADLVALNRILYVECYAMQDTTPVNLSGFTTDADHYIRIYTPSSERHQGKWDTSKYRLETSGQAINIAANYVRIEGLQIQVTASSGTNANGIRTVNVAGAGDIWISHCIIKGVLSGTVTYSDGISNGPDTATVVRIFNNLFLDWNRSGASTFIGGIYTSSGTANYFNNTFVNCYQGMYRNGGNVVAKNNLMYTCNQPAGGTFDAGTDYNATDNASMGYTVTGGGNTHDRTSQAFTFINEAGGDYHLAASDAGAKDHGISDPGSGLFSDDIDGQTRTGTWDIGADEYATGTQPTIRTVTVKPSGGNYTSLNAALAAEAGDLVALNSILHVECFAMQDTTAVNLTGFTTDADHYIRIYTPSSERHQGKWDTSKYRLETSGQAINIAANYVRIEGLQIQVTASSGTNANGIRTVNVAGAGDIWISHCIIKGVLSGTVTYTDGISNGPASDTLVVRIFNNLFLDWNRSGASTYIGGVFTSRGTAYYFNNNFVNCYQGMYRDGGNVVAKNNLMYLCNYPAGGTFDVGTDYNATNNGSIGYTVTGGGNTHDRLSQTFSFVNETNGDYHLAASDAGAKDHGVSDPGSGLFSDDIDGQTRQTIWDIGADEQ